MTVLQYRVQNAGPYQSQTKVVIDGRTGVFTDPRFGVDLVPVGHNGGTISLDLPPDTEGFAEGAEFTVTFEAAPAASDASAPTEGA